jgi:tetratricopeptide (TPR) repeat protein
MSRCIGLLFLSVCAVSATQAQGSRAQLRGVIRAKKADYLRAIDDFDQAIKLAPSLADAWFNRAAVLLREGRLPEAAADLARYHELVGKSKPEEEELWRELRGQLKQK